MYYPSSTKKFYNKKPIATPSSKAKRWYVDASANVPYFGSVGFKAGDGQLNKRSITAMVKREARLTEGSKYKTSIQSQVFNAQTWYTYNPLGNIPIGTGENSRLSTDIFVKSVKMRVLMYNNILLTGGLVGAPIHVRVVWLRTNVPIAGGVDTFTSGLGNSDLLVQGLTIPLTGVFDRDKVTILSDDTYTVPQSNIATTYSSICADISCPSLNIPFKYGSSTSNYSVLNKNLYCVVSPSIAADVVGTTVELNFQFQSAVEFTDSR
jgi:hypothetical protein